tara:strand:- start:75 stop:305 length:231 start_codon:yes stop_codon:yes gene_type:complete
MPTTTTNTISMLSAHHFVTSDMWGGRLAGAAFRLVLRPNPRRGDFRSPTKASHTIFGSDNLPREMSVHSWAADNKH